MSVRIPEVPGIGAMERVYFRFMVTTDAPATLMWIGPDRVVYSDGAVMLKHGDDLLYNPVTVETGKFYQCLITPDGMLVTPAPKIEGPWHPDVRFYG